MRADDAADVEAGRDDAEHAPRRARRRGPAHQHVARGLDHAEDDAGSPHGQDQRRRRQRQGGDEKHDGGGQAEAQGRNVAVARRSCPPASRPAGRRSRSRRDRPSAPCWRRRTPRHGWRRGPPRRSCRCRCWTRASSVKKPVMRQHARRQHGGDACRRLPWQRSGRHGSDRSTAAGWAGGTRASAVARPMQPGERERRLEPAEGGKRQQDRAARRRRRGSRRRCGSRTRGRPCVSAMLSARIA